LDSSILDRPSRFDRKYYFELPGETERLAYVRKWNQELQAEMRVTAAGAAALVQRTGGFSFAYLKELFVAAMVQWLSSGGSGRMDDIILSQANLLRGQMNSKQESVSNP
jgi:AAA+ superfamily predicted ATPase